MSGLTVCLSFDIDAYSPMLFAGEQSVAALSRGEFSTDVAVPRLVALLSEYGIKATFFIPGHTARWCPQVVRPSLNTVMRSGITVICMSRPPASPGPGGGCAPDGHRGA